MESLLFTPKRKNRNRSNSEPSPEDNKRLRESNSPAELSRDEEAVMDAIASKLDVVLSKLSNLETQFEELNLAVKGLQCKVTSLEVDVDSVKTKQKTLDGNYTYTEKNAVFVDEHLKKLHSESVKTNNYVSETRKELLYLEAYGQLENWKFEGIPERNSQQIPEEENGTGQQGKAPTENTQAVLTEFLENVLGIQDAHGIECQRVHRLGKPRKENDKGRVIIVRFLRYKDRERVFKCGRKLKDTEYKIYEDLPKEIHEMRKRQMEKLNKARKGGKQAYFSKSEPDKLYINGKYVQM